MYHFPTTPISAKTLKFMYYWDGKMLADVNECTSLYTRSSILVVDKVHVVTTKYPWAGPHSDLFSTLTTMVQHSKHMPLLTIHYKIDKIVLTDFKIHNLVHYWQYALTWVVESTSEAQSILWQRQQWASPSYSSTNATLSQTKKYWSWGVLSPA